MPTLRLMISARPGAAERMTTITLDDSADTAAAITTATNAVTAHGGNVRIATTPAEQAALVTIETVERLAVRAAEALQASDTARALRLLAALTDETVTRTATAVKDQMLSDEIAAQVADRMRSHLDP